MSSSRNDPDPADEPAKPAPTSVTDSCFWPRQVDPEEARRKPSEPEVDRSVVELTSPIGHRLRVRPNTAGATAPPAADPAPPKK
jgi:hypothetical protein